MFGEGSGHVLLDDVQCTGEEDELLDCSHASIGDHRCGKLFQDQLIQSPHKFDIAIRCQGMKVVSLNLHVSIILLHDI